MSLAIIPARGGSKRIPGKNIRLFRGRPIISWVIEAALASDCFSEVMVSTDSQEIAEVALACGAKVPFLRSDATSDDNVSVALAVREVLAQYRARGDEFDLACCLFATSALLRPVRLKEAKKLLLSHPEAEGAISLVRTAQPLSRALVIRNGMADFLSGHMKLARSQDLDETYLDAAQMYWVRPNAYLSGQGPTMAFLKRLPLVLSEFETQDINTEEDWQLAEAKHLFVEQHPTILPSGEFDL